MESNKEAGSAGSAKLAPVIQIDEQQIRDHVGQVVRGTVEETLNAMLSAEADVLCNATRYERSADRADTGADSTCFPAKFARMIGHDNSADGVEVSQFHGVCGKTAVYLHSLRLSLLDPDEPSSPRELPRKVWKSKITRFGFVSRFSGRYGLLGRDVMKEWKKVRMEPRAGSWILRIQL